MFSLKDKKILLTGGEGFLGSFVFKELLKKGVRKDDIFIPRIQDYDLRKMESCQKVSKDKDLVIHLAGNVGGILFNKEHPAQTFFDNAAMSLNLIHASYRSRVKKFVGIGSICEYPKITPVPFKEEDLWNGYPEETNAPYGLAKKFMLVQSQAYRAEYEFNAIHLLLLNLYGPGDNFDLKTSHVIPALIKKVADARKENRNYIEVLGTGKATRDFLYAEDAAEGILLASEKYDNPGPVNLGSGMEISIKDLAELICRIMNFRGEIRWDASQPDGQPRRRVDILKAEKEFGFKAKTSFEKGLRETIKWYLSQR